MKNLKSIITLSILLGISNLNAQEVTDYDLHRFAKAYVEMVKLNTKAQSEMAEIIADEKLDLEIYHAINDTKDNPDLEPDVPKEDFEKYAKVQPKIEKVQDELEADVQKAYAKQEFTTREYAAIAERVKQDPLLITKLEKMLTQLR